MSTVTAPPPWPARALAAVLAVDLTGTAMLGAVTVGRPTPVLTALLVVAASGLACAVVAVGMAGATLTREAPSRRVLAGAIALVGTGLAVNTLGSASVALTMPGSVPQAATLLVAGDVLSCLYASLLGRAWP